MVFQTANGEVIKETHGSPATVQRMNAQTTTIVPPCGSILGATNDWVILPTESNGIFICSFLDDQQFQIGSGDHLKPKVRACFTDSSAMTMAVSHERSIKVYPVKLHASTNSCAPSTIPRRGSVVLLPMLNGFAAFSDRGVEAFVVSYTEEGVIRINSFVAANMEAPAGVTRLVPGPLHVSDGFDKQPCRPLQFAAQLARNLYVYQHPVNFMVYVIGIAAIADTVPELAHGPSKQHEYLVCDPTERALGAFVHYPVSGQKDAILMVATSVRVYCMPLHPKLQSDLPYTAESCKVVEHQRPHPTNAAFQRARDAVYLHCDDKSMEIPL